MVGKCNFVVPGLSKYDNPCIFMEGAGDEWYYQNVDLIHKPEEETEKGTAGQHRGFIQWIVMLIENAGKGKFERRKNYRDILKAWKEILANAIKYPTARIVWV